MQVSTPHDLKDRSSERNCEAESFQALLKQGLGMWMYYIVGMIAFIVVF